MNWSLTLLNSNWSKIFVFIASIIAHLPMSRLDTLKQVVQHKVETVDSIGMKAIIVTKTVNLIIKCEKSTKGTDEPSIRSNFF